MRIKNVIFRNRLPLICAVIQWYVTVLLQVDRSFLYMIMKQNTTWLLNHCTWFSCWQHGALASTYIEKLENRIRTIYARCRYFFHIWQFCSDFYWFYGQVHGQEMILGPWTEYGDIILFLHGKILLQVFIKMFFCRYCHSLEDLYFFKMW